MDIQFHLHLSTWHLMPVLTLSEMTCECCGEDAGTVLEIGWLVGSITVVFGTQQGPGH